MSKRVPADQKLLEQAARLADLPLGPQRLEQLVPEMNGFFQLLDVLHSGDLGETPPAIAFRARRTEP